MELCLTGQANMKRVSMAIALAVFAVPCIASTESVTQALRAPGAGVETAPVQEVDDASAARVAVDRAASGRVTFTGAIVMPAGGAHPGQPLIHRSHVVQTIRGDRFMVLEVTYR